MAIDIPGRKRSLVKNIIAQTSLTNSSREKPSKLFELENNWSAIILMVSSRGMLVNSDVTSKLAITFKFSRQKLPFHFQWKIL